MRIQIMSDLHVEFEDFMPFDAGADVVVLAGDISVKGRCMDWAKTAFAQFNCPVLVCAGNHDYYGGHLGKTLLKMTDASIEHVRFMDCNEFVFGGVRFLGATGWTDYSATGNTPLAMWDAQTAMADFKKVRAGSTYRKLHPDDLAERSRYTKQWLREKLSEPFDGKTVVFTHHAPSMLSLEKCRGNTHLDAAYANRWEDLMGDRLALWMHGHSHAPVDYDLCGTRVVSNPRGYPGENCGFKPGFVVEV